MATGIAPAALVSTAAWVGLALDVDVVWRGNRWNLDLGGGAR